MAARRGVTVGRADGLETGSAISYDSVKFSQNAQRGSGDTMARTEETEAKKRKIKVEVNEEVEENELAMMINPNTRSSTAGRVLGA